MSREWYIKYDRKFRTIAAWRGQRRAVEINVDEYSRTDSGRDLGTHRGKTLKFQRSWLPELSAHNGHPAVDMHFREMPSPRFNINENRRKYTRNTRRRGQDVPKKFRRIRIVARGDLAHVPDRSALRIYIRGYDIEVTSCSILFRNGREHLGVDVPRDQFP
jgi:hypothetical protein